jgi:hypothetical protein
VGDVAHELRRHGAGLDDDHAQIGLKLLPQRRVKLDPGQPRAGSKRDSASMRAKTSTQTRTFSR